MRVATKTLKVLSRAKRIRKEGKKLEIRNGNQSCLTAKSDLNKKTNKRPLKTNKSIQ